MRKKHGSGYHENFFSQNAVKPCEFPYRNRILLIMKKISNIHVDDHDRHAIEAASRMLKKRFRMVEQVILFGSKARGDDVEDSDIDLLLLTSRPIDWRERGAILDALFDIEMAFDVLISILVKTSAEWENGICTAYPVHQEISKEGVLA